MGSCRRAALTSIEERGQVLEVDLPQVPRQDSAGRIQQAVRQRWSKVKRRGE